MDRRSSSSNNDNDRHRRQRAELRETQRGSQTQPHHQVFTATSGTENIPPIDPRIASAQELNRLMGAEHVFGTGGISARFQAAPIYADDWLDRGQVNEPVLDPRPQNIDNIYHFDDITNRPIEHPPLREVNIRRGSQNDPETEVKILIGHISQFSGQPGLYFSQDNNTVIYLPREALQLNGRHYHYPLQIYEEMLRLNPGTTANRHSVRATISHSMNEDRNQSPTYIGNWNVTYIE